MSKFFCEQVVAPGIVVGLEHESNLSLSTWGVTVPYAHWFGLAKPDIVARFKEYSLGDSYTQIPVLEFSNSEEWKLRFSSFPTSVKPLCWLDDFLSGNSKAVPMTLWASSRRDGGRYYRELLTDLQLLARAASRDFTKEELTLECYGMQKLIEHCRAIYNWKSERPNWREWKTAYEPGHRFHFTLF